MKPLKNPIVREAAKAMQEAFQSGNKEKMNAAWEQFHQAVCDTIKQDFESTQGDKSVLMERGYRILTAKEQEFYEKFIEAAKSSDPKQSFTDLIEIEGGMPETVIQDVYRNLVNEHPLLDTISFTNVSYLTRWIMNDHTIQTATWGPINEKIKKEISSAFKELDMVQCKLSCFAIIPQDMLELGPVYLDNYIRTILTDALATALENAIVTGTGKDMPIGLDRNISKEVAVVDGVYPRKEATEVTSFLPAEYGGLIAKLCKTENGRYRKIEGLTLICNPVDYYKKVMPATTVLTATGTFMGDVFPVPTKTVQSAELTEGEAILCLPKEYFMGLGSAKNGTITYDDSVKFIEDDRVYKIKLFANGRAFDNTVALLLDISGLEPAYITVLNKNGARDIPTEEIPTA
ncbi:MAG: phage major capsid protein [Lachnospiraceae bacterium]|nr:phage major capsid protein [Lachnospiraceae bacterium]